MFKFTVFIILSVLFLETYSQNLFELHGRVKIDDGNRKGVRIVVTKNGSPYKTFRIDAQGKYSFPLDYNNVYIVAFEKNGFVTKRVEINTNVTPDVLADNNFKYKWKVDVGLFKEYEGIDFSFFNQPIQKIFFVEKSKRFDYDNKYAKQIEKELKRLIAEVEKKKIEEAKQKELEKQKQLAAQKQQQVQQQTQAKTQTKPKKRYTNTSSSNKYKNIEYTPVVKDKNVCEPNITTKTESDEKKEVTYISVVYKGVEHIYRKVKWYWGAEFYFRDNENISYAVYELETSKGYYTGNIIK